MFFFKFYHSQFSAMSLLFPSLLIEGSTFRQNSVHYNGAYLSAGWLCTSRCLLGHHSCSKFTLRTKRKQLCKNTDNMKSRALTKNKHIQTKIELLTKNSSTNTNKRKPSPHSQGQIKAINKEKNTFREWITLNLLKSPLLRFFSAAFLRASGGR